MKSDEEHKGNKAPIKRNKKRSLAPFEYKEAVVTAVPDEPRFKRPVTNCPAMRGPGGADSGDEGAISDNGPRCADNALTAGWRGS